MYCDSLQDLKLAGVQWELTEIPMAIILANNALKNITPKSPVAAQTDAPTADAARVATTAIVPPISPVQTISVDTAVAMASRPTTTDAMIRMISEFNHPLRGSVTNVVAPSIAKNPNGLVIVTDIPSADDDACGQILTGVAGELLDKMIAAIGMSRDSVSIIPMMFWRTPGGRAPSRTELDLSRPFVDNLIQMLKPRVILTLGTLPAMELAGVQLPRAHGEISTVYNGVQLMPIFHPNYLLLKPTAKRDAWTALQSVQNLLKSA